MRKIVLFLAVFLLPVVQFSVAPQGFHIETDTVSAATTKPSPAPSPAPTPVPTPSPTNTAPVASAVWSSQPSSWALQDILKAQAYGLTDADIMAQYNRPVTRLQFVRLVMKQYYASGGATGSSAGVLPFSDTTDSTVTSAFKIGFILGSSNGKFSPDKQLTRQEAAVILYREWAVLNAVASDSIIYPRVFSDSGKIAPWAEDAVRYMNQIGVLIGLDNGKINPTGPMTREQSMVLVLRNYESLAGEMNINLPESTTPDAVSSPTVNQSDTENDDDGDDDDD